MDPMGCVYPWDDMTVMMIQFPPHAKEELGVQAPVGFWVTWKDLEFGKCRIWNLTNYKRIQISDFGSGSPLQYP